MFEIFVSVVSFSNVTAIIYLEQEDEVCCLRVSNQAFRLCPSLTSQLENRSTDFRTILRWGIFRKYVT
jgi:hypothetical protein